MNKIDLPCCCVVFFVVCPLLRPIWRDFSELSFLGFPLLRELQIGLRRRQTTKNTAQLNLSNNSSSHNKEYDHNRVGGLDIWCLNVYDFIFLLLLLSFCFDWEDISNLEIVFHRISKHLEFLQKCSTFSTFFLVFGNRMKHHLPCLIYCISNILIIQFSQINKSTL